MALESLPSVHRAEFVNKVVEAVLNRKEEDVKMVGELFSSARSSGLLDDDSVEKGVKDHVEFLDDISIDVPNAYGFMATLLVSAGLSVDKIESLAATIQGEGVKPPKERLMAKVNDLL
jgi:translation initiation factor 4G